MEEKQTISPVSIAIQSVTFKELIRGDELISDAVIRDEMQGFREDYLVLHYLLKISKAICKSVLEIGTHQGLGTKVIKNAVGDNVKVYSLDLPDEEAGKTLQHPTRQQDVRKTGELCDLEYTQLYGDSLLFDYASIAPVSAWFIDGEHDYAHVLHESIQAIKYGAKLVIWHGADMEEVYRAIKDAFKWEKNYRLTRVEDTRMMYAVRMHGSSKGL